MLNDGTVPRPRIVWVVRRGDDVYADHDVDDAINEEYRRKYGRSSAVEHITSPKAQATTLRIVGS